MRGRPGRSDRWWLPCLALAAAVVGGCAETETPGLDVESAVLETPDGRYPLEAAAIHEVCWGWPVVIAGGSERLRVEFNALAPCPLLRIGEPVTAFDNRYGETRQLVGRTFGIELVPDASYYRLNDGPPEPLGLETRPPPTAAYPPTFVPVTPPALQDFPMHLIGGNLYPQVAEGIRAHEDDRHTFHVAFTVDGRPHRLHVVYRLRVRKGYTVRAPATP